MKILIMCPGSWTAGLNSPERGEGRWAQNYSVMLAKAGHEVYAASGGGSRTPVTENGVKLIDQHPSVCKLYEPYDLFIDPCWWENKKPAALAKKYIALKWSPENYLWKELPTDYYLAYPYTVHNYNFSKLDFPNKHKSFALPTMFGEEFKKPDFSRESIFLPGKIDINRPYKKYNSVIKQILSSNKIEGRSKSFFENEFKSEIDFNKEGSNWKESTPYNEVLKSLSVSKLSFPILNPGCIIEAAFQGTPSVFWDHGGFFNPLSQMLNINIQHDAEPERVLEVINDTLSCKKRYNEIVMISQDYFIAHTYYGALKYFNEMIESIF